eukprot:jgi/Mesvir1/7222/Mv19040-RA.1
MSEDIPAFEQSPSQGAAVPRQEAEGPLHPYSQPETASTFVQAAHLARGLARVGWVAVFGNAEGPSANDPVVMRVRATTSPGETSRVTVERLIALRDEVAALIFSLEIAYQGGHVTLHGLDLAREALGQLVAISLGATRLFNHWVATSSLGEGTNASHLVRDAQLGRDLSPQAVHDEFVDRPSGIITRSFQQLDEGDGSAAGFSERQRADYHVPPEPLHDYSTYGSGAYNERRGGGGRWVRNLLWGRRPNERRVPFDQTSDGRPVSRLLGPYSEEEVRAIPRVRTPVAATAEEREREAAAEAEREAEELPDA